jgi:SAM-dependent methyltransferase
MKTDDVTLPNLAAGRPAQRDDLLLARRYRLVQPHLPEHGGVLLDFGCGNGAQTFSFAPHFDTVLGLDIDRRYLGEFATDQERRSIVPRAWPVCFDGGELPVRTASVDFVITFEVLEHVRNEHLALAEMHRILRPGGVLAISVPNRWWIFETHGADLPLLRWNRVPLFSWLPKRLHDRFARARIYRRCEIRKLMEAAGFEIRQESYVTAPMDVVRWALLQRVLRWMVFGRDRTPLPMLATSCLAVAIKQDCVTD